VANGNRYSLERVHQNITRALGSTKFGKAGVDFKVRKRMWYLRRGLFLVLQSDNVGD
jgi:hypothetical protein